MKGALADMTARDRLLKRGFDLTMALLGLLVLWPIVLGATALAAWDTGASGIFAQTRIGRGGKSFTIYKIRTMRPNSGSTVTTSNDARITPVGLWLRRLKFDELPQLWNILKGDMSLVGPRPDVPGYADQLKGKARQILSLRPGITGPATLKYRDEEALLASVESPQRYNDEVIWPDKVRINLEYWCDYKFSKDIRYLLATGGLVEHGVE